jgi:hypothetical protein
MLRGDRSAFGLIHDLAVLRLVCWRLMMIAARM